MKNKIFLSIILGILILPMVSVNAKVILKEDIEDNSYIIGNYYYTRKANSENNYNGTLTTPEIMMAAKTIDGGLNKMIIYHKTFLGDWVNGLTGEPLTPPEYFEIENRNLKDIIKTPDLNCRWMTSSDVSFANCESNFKNNDNIYYDSYYIDSSGATARLSDKEKYGIEYYILKDSNGKNPIDNVSYNNGKFFSNGKEYTPLVTDFKTAYSNSEFYNIVSRFYYMDGNEKIYSEYSKIVDNGALSKLELNNQQIPKLKAELTDVRLQINPNNLKEPIYYNVNFKLQNVDTTKYDIAEFNVYSTNGNYQINDSIYSKMKSLENGTDSFIDLYVENSSKDKYTKPHHHSCEYNSAGEGLCSNWYLVASASASGNTTDTSKETAYSIRFEETDSSGATNTPYVAYLKLCEKNDNSKCYNAKTNITYSIVSSWMVTDYVNSKTYYESYEKAREGAIKRAEQLASAPLSQNAKDYMTISVSNNLSEDIWSTINIKTYGKLTEKFYRGNDELQETIVEDYKYTVPKDNEYFKIIKVTTTNNLNNSSTTKYNGASGKWILTNIGGTGIKEEYDSYEKAYNALKSYVKQNMSPEMWIYQDEGKVKWMVMSISGNKTTEIYYNGSDTAQIKVEKVVNQTADNEYYYDEITTTTTNLITGESTVSVSRVITGTVPKPILP